MQTQIKTLSLSNDYEVEMVIRLNLADTFDSLTVTYTWVYQPVERSQKISTQLTITAMTQHRQRTVHLSVPHEDNIAVETAETLATILGEAIMVAQHL